MTLNSTQIPDIEYNTVLKRIEDNEFSIFSFQKLKNELGWHEKKLRNILEALVKKEFLFRIEKGKFVRRTFKNEYVIGNFLTEDAVIAYWSALNIHGLTEQFPNKIFVQTSKKKQNREIFGVQYQIVKVHPKKIAGIIKKGVGDNQFRITDIEKTLCDCFDLPQYSGGTMELIRAFKRTKLNAKKMIDYSMAIGNSAATKRLGFLAELFAKKELKNFIKIAKEQKSKNFDLLDVFGNKQGKYISDWNLRLNIEEQEIIEIANSIY